MFRRAGTTLRPHLRYFQTQASASARPLQKWHPALLASTALVVGGSAIWQLRSQVIHNEALPVLPSEAYAATLPAVDFATLDPEHLHGLVWGSNKTKTLAPDNPLIEHVRYPAIAPWLEGAALRDLQFHQRHAACIDANGDVYQWGEGFFGLTGASQTQKPQLTLKGKNIIQLQLSDDRVFALSSSGKIYALSSESAKQQLKASPAKSSSTGWFGGQEETIDFVEMLPREQLGRREYFVSISAGNNHVLALTSSGRAFAHPINTKANMYGQLGFRKFDMPSPDQVFSPTSPRVPVELVPKSLAEPGSRNSKYNPPLASENLQNVDDQSIRFCPIFFEIPALRGVPIAQIAAGGRHSFARTPTGRVLGWGANDHGQIGLGNVVLDTITVPTEVILWKRSAGEGAMCLDVSSGGDLTAFTVKQSDGSSDETIEVLTCGDGQYGGLGNNQYSNAQGRPVRVKAISGLKEFNDATNSVEAIIPRSVIVSPTGHVLLTLDTSRDGRPARDLALWGKNTESELGNGKKSNQSVPLFLASAKEERVMLRKQKAKEVRDLKGSVWKKGVTVEQIAVAGYGSSAVYWKIS